MNVPLSTMARSSLTSLPDQTPFESALFRSETERVRFHRRGLQIVGQENSETIDSVRSRPRISLFRNAVWSLVARCGVLETKSVWNASSFQKLYESIVSNPVDRVRSGHRLRPALAGGDACRKGSGATQITA